MKKLKGFWEGVADAFSFSMMLIVALMIFTLLLAGCAAPSAPNMPSRIRSDVVSELNKYRISRGLQAVDTNPRIDALASERARHAWPYRYKNLEQGHSYFQQMVNRSGAQGLWFGENLYAHHYSPTASAMISGWHTSYGHMKMMNRKTMDNCGAAEAYDGKMSVVALICADRKSRERL